MIDNLIWGKSDIIFFDMPPGTWDIYFTFFQKNIFFSSLLITTPHNLSINDIVKTNTILDKYKSNKIGIVENMSYHICENCGHKKNIFFHGNVKSLSKLLKIDYLYIMPIFSKFSNFLTNDHLLNNFYVNVFFYKFLFKLFNFSYKKEFFFLINKKSFFI